MDKFEVLKQYKELLEMGIISQKEFDEKKKQLLGLEKTVEEAVDESGPEKTDEGAAAEAPMKESDELTAANVDIATASDADIEGASGAVAEEIPGNDPSNAESVDPAEAPKTAKKSNKALIAVIAGIILVAAVAAVVILKPGMGSGGTDAVAENADETAADSTEAASGIDYQKPDKVVESLPLGEATLDLPGDWYYEKTDNGDNNINYVIYYSDKKPEKLDNCIFAILFKKAMNMEEGVVFSKDVIKTTLDFHAKNFMVQAYPGEREVEEYIERDGLPAYHSVIHQTDENDTDITYDNYNFMINDQQMLVLLSVHNNHITTDRSEEFMEFVRGIRIPLKASDVK